MREFFGKKLCCNGKESVRLGGAKRLRLHTKQSLNLSKGSASGLIAAQLRVYVVVLKEICDAQA